jgi:hypothetical protein
MKPLLYSLPRIHAAQRANFGLYIPRPCVILIDEAFSNDHEQIAWWQQKDMWSDQDGTWHKRRKTTAQEQQVKNGSVPGFFRFWLNEAAAHNGYAEGTLC